MASNVQQYQQSTQQQAQHQQQPQQQPGSSSPHHCIECGLYLNSAESLEVHLQYHKENLLNKWATQAAATGHSDEANNNTASQPKIKREFANTIAAADSSDSMMKKSPEYGSRATPEINVSFGHPPTPQSYHSASSPYQTPDNSAFSPGFQNFAPQIKAERGSPQHFNPQQQMQQQQNYQSFQDPQQFYNMDGGYQQQQQQQQEYMPKMGQNNYRYHPYQQHNAHQVTSSSPAYPPQPTPSPSPKQCDKCGYVCESAAQLIDHLNVAHPPTPAPHLTGNYQQNHFLFGGSADTVVKTEAEDVQSEILDLDSHKVVHQVYPEEADKRDMNNGQNPHSVTAMLSPWSQQQPQQNVPSSISNQQQQQQQQQVVQQQQQQQAKMFPESFQPDTKLFQTPKFHGQVPQQHEFMAGAPGMIPEHAGYRSFEHMPPQPTPPVITSTQVPNNPIQAPQPTQKSANWKSNEARRPKTYNCTACNKWFTSSGHLKRHYNTTLHKNAVKSSGQPDPATLPISAHHHPARESATNRDEPSRSPGDDSRSEDSLNNSYERAGGMPGLLQQPPAGPYDRQPAPNILHPLHSPMGPNTLPASPPNGEAGLSASTNTIDSRGLLSISNTPSVNSTTSISNNHGFNLAVPPAPPHMMSTGTMDNQFQMYPNECAPHVTQDTAATTNSLNTIGEYQQHQQQQQHQQHQPADISTQVLVVQPTVDVMNQPQPLPSFAQLQNTRGGLLLGFNVASVGGPGPVTAPYHTTTYYAIGAEQQHFQQQQPQDDYKLTVLKPAPIDSMTMIEQKTNTMEDLKIKFETQPASPEKAHTKRDYEESTGSPRITSTSNNNNTIINNKNNTANLQVSKNGLHKCYDCDKVFNKVCYLTQHNKTFHSGDKPFKCSRCGKRFSGDSQYQEHLTKHAGEKPHKCDLCPKQFNHKTDLRRHMCLHTGQKPFACIVCQKGFIRKDHMLKHVETHSRKPQNRGQRRVTVIQTSG